MGFYDKMKRGFDILMDDPSRMTESAKKQAGKIGDAAEELVPDPRAAKGLINVLGEVADVGKKKAKALAKALREKED